MGVPLVNALSEKISSTVPKHANPTMRNPNPVPIQNPSVNPSTSGFRSAIPFRIMKIIQPANPRNVRAMRRCPIAIGILSLQNRFASVIICSSCSGFIFYLLLPTLRISRGYEPSRASGLLCAGQARLLAGALRERTNFQFRVKRNGEGGADQ